MHQNYVFMQKVRYILLIVGMLLLLAGAVLSIMQYQPWANYVLIAGAALIIIRGFIRVDNNKDQENEPK